MLFAELDQIADELARRGHSDLARRVRTAARREPTPTEREEARSVWAKLKGKMKARADGLRLEIAPSDWRIGVTSRRNGEDAPITRMKEHGIEVGSIVFEDVTDPIVGLAVESLAEGEGYDAGAQFNPSGGEQPVVYAFIQP